MPDTTPVAEIEPSAILLLLHVPPAGVLFSEVVSPKQTLVVPVIAVGNALTVTIVDTLQPVDNV